MVELIAIAGYGIMMGMTVGVMKHRSGEGDHWDWIDHPEVVISVFWPVILPAFLGASVVALVTGDRLSRAERRREKELTEAKHRAELARIAFEEDQYLTSQLALNGKVK